MREDDISGSIPPRIKIRGILETVMKITIDARLYGLENAGLGRYVMKLIEHLGRIDRRNKYAVLLRKKYFDELKLPPNWTKVLADFRHYSFTEQVKLPKILTQTFPDLVHFPHFNIPISYAGKFVVTIHDMLMHRMKGQATTTLSLPAFLIKRFGYKYVFKKAVKDSLRIIVPSNFVKRELADFYQVDIGKISVTYEGVELPMVASSNVLEKYGIKEKYFIYAGNAYPHKNLERLVKAIVRLNENHNLKVALLIASSRSVFSEKLEKLVSKIGANKQVKLLGFVPDNDLFTLYKNSVGFVFPSISEGFGLPGLEAMAAGTLAIVSDIPVFKEIYKENAKYFNPFDFSSLEKTLWEILNMPREMREENIQNGQKFVSRYSWEKMARETLSVYKEAIKQ